MYILSSPRTFRKSAPLANYDLKMVSKNWANFVLNCAIIFKFCAASLPEISPKEILRANRPPHNVNFDLKRYQKNCANFVLNCDAFLKFCVAPIPEISPRMFWEPAVENIIDFQYFQLSTASLISWASLISYVNIRFCVFLKTPKIFG